MYNVSTQITAKATNGKKKKERETYSNGNDCNPKIEIRPYIEHQKQMTVCLENLQYQVWSDQTTIYKMGYKTWWEVQDYKL